MALKGTAAPCKYSLDRTGDSNQGSGLTLRGFRAGAGGGGVMAATAAYTLNPEPLDFKLLHALGFGRVGLAESRSSG